MRRLLPGLTAGMQIAEVVIVGEGANPLAHNSLWQLRNDAWSSLEEGAWFPARSRLPRLR